MSKLFEGGPGDFRQPAEDALREPKLYSAEFDRSYARGYDPEPGFAVGDHVTVPPPFGLSVRRLGTVEHVGRYFTYVRMSATDELRAFMHKEITKGVAP